MRTLLHRGPLLVIATGAIALVAFGVIAFAVAAAGSAPQPSEAEQMRADLALMRSEIQALRKDLRDLRTRSDSLEKKLAAIPTGEARVRPLLSEQDRTLVPPAGPASASATASK